MLSGGKHAARRIKRARILLAADAGISDEEIRRFIRNIPCGRGASVMRERLISEIAAWQKARNDSEARIHWRVTTEQARTKLARAYPDLDK